MPSFSREACLLEKTKRKEAKDSGATGAAETDSVRTQQLREGRT